MTPFPTPTLPYSFGATSTPSLNISQLEYSSAAGIVQGYNVVNAYGIMDMFWMAVILIVLILGLWVTITRIKDA